LEGFARFGYSQCNQSVHARAGTPIGIDTRFFTGAGGYSIFAAWNNIGMTDGYATSPRERRIALIGHDLRSAVGDVVGGLQLLDETGLDPDALLQLERVRAASEALGRLVDEAVAALAEGTAPADPGSPEERRSLTLADFVRDLERRWAGHAAAQGLAMTAEFGPDLPDAVALPPLTLERILGNLLDNAHKYAQRGRIVLAVERAACGTLSFSVRDAGPGFSDASLARLFELSGRPPHSPQPGTGLGLHIAKDLADRLGGWLDIRNRPDGGAEVTLALPRSAWCPEERALADAPASPDLRGLRVLIADDGATNRRLMAEMLTRLGATCDLAEDGIAARDALAARDYDLALVDIHMPRLTGTEVVAAVRALPGPRAEVPILAVSAFVLQLHRDQIYAAGADGILTKPVVSVAAAGEAVRETLRRAAARRAAPEHAAGATAEPPGRNALPPFGTTPDPAGRLDAARLRHLLDIAGPGTRQELLDRLACDLDRAATGLDDAAARGDLASVRSQTHVLISLTGAVGAEGLQARMEAVNAAAHAGDADAIEAGVEAARLPLRALCDEIAAARQSEAQARDAGPAPTASLPLPPLEVRQA
jgi:CheY-like chemotaxis protein